MSTLAPRLEPCWKAIAHTRRTSRREATQTAERQFRRTPVGECAWRSFKGRAARGANGLRMVKRSRLLRTTKTTNARRYPSRIRLADVLADHSASAARGPCRRSARRNIPQRYGARFPLLPKFLDIAELLPCSRIPKQYRCLCDHRCGSGRDDQAWVQRDIDGEKTKARLTVPRAATNARAAVVLKSCECVAEHAAAVARERGSSSAALESTVRRCWPVCHVGASRRASVVLHVLYWNARFNDEIPVARPGNSQH